VALEHLSTKTVEMVDLVVAVTEQAAPAELEY
jgi:CO dehydrogenase nickel-insertion accessory protein CooC1